MNRLTEEDDCGNWGLKGLNWRALYPGEEITQKMYQILYGALAKLKDYEDTGLTPDEIADGQVLSGWIPAEEQLPKPRRWALVTVHHSDWVSDYHSDWVPDSEKVCHPETRCSYIGFLKENGEWVFIDLDGQENICDKSFGDDKGCVYDVVTAWQKFPKPHIESYRKQPEKELQEEWKRHIQKRFEQAE